MEQIKDKLKNIRSEVENDINSSELLELINLAIENPGELSFKHHRALVEGLKKSITKFEISHPRLVEEVKVIVNSLNDIGI
jgi:hypothetical protein